MVNVTFFGAFLLFIIAIYEKMKALNDEIERTRSIFNFSFRSLAFSGAHCVLLLIGIEKANKKIKMKSSIRTNALELKVISHFQT